jgi:hypothetical protein
MAAAAVLGFAQQARAVPPVSGLQPAANYGTVSAQIVSQTATTCTYRFTVTDTHPTDGIKGLLVYGPMPLSMNSLPRTQTSLYNAGRATWWDFNGAPDANNNGIADSFIEPGQTRSDFLLTYKQPCPPISSLVFGLHVVLPGGQTFFAGANPMVCAKIGGTVKCPDGHVVAGAKVELLQGGGVVKTVFTNASGEFSFSNVADGTYSIRISATDYETAVSAPFSYTCAGNDLSMAVVLKPLAINLNCQECLKGKVFFGVSSGYVRRATTGLTLTQADLYNPAYASPNLTTSYKYVGFIPNFPELGHFGGAGEPVVYVIVQEPLLGEDVFNNCSFSNQIGVAGALGAHPLSSNPSTFTYRSLFSLPNLGPGTAHMFTYTGIELIPNPLATPAGSFSVLPAVQISGSPAPAPAAGDLPPGWMAKARIQFQLPQASTTVVYMNGTYQDACGDMFMFHCHPDMGGGVGD